LALANVRVFSSGAETILNEATNNLEVEQTPEQLQPKERPNLDNTAGLSTSEFPEPEKVLHQPGFDTVNRDDELGQVTMERVVSEMDGSIDKTNSLIGKKRPLEDDSLLHFEKSSTERVSSRQRVKKTNSDFLPHDHDLLTSILGNLFIYYTLIKSNFYLANYWWVLHSVYFFICFKKKLVALILEALIEPNQLIDISWQLASIIWQSKYSLVTIHKNRTSVFLYPINNSAINTKIYCLVPCK
jgi:hypothetical protein